MSLRDFVFGPDAATGSVNAPDLSELSTRRAEAIPTFSPGQPPASSLMQRIMGAALPMPQPKNEVTGGDYGKALAITMGDFAKAPVGALENLTGQLAGDESDTAERQLAGTQRGLGDVRRSIGEWQKGFFQSMSPEALDRAQRELSTLDPNKTIWQGGPGEFLSSLALKGTLSLGPTIGPMITTALLSRMGVGAAASTLYGTQEGLMSAGLTAAQIAENIEQTPIDELRKVQNFRTLEAQVGEAEARRQFINQVQGMVPAVTGLLVGSIAKLVGKPLDKIFGTGKGLPFAGRVRAGATTEALQEGPQSFSEQVLQNYAEMSYNSNVNLLDGAFEQTLQGMLLGGVMGGTFAGAFGNRPQNRALTGDPIPADIRAALSNAGGLPPSASPSTGGTPAQSRAGVPPGPSAIPQAPDTAGPVAPPDLVATEGAGIPLVNRFSARPRLDEQVQGIPFEPPQDTWRQSAPPATGFPSSDVVDFPQPEPPLTAAPYDPRKLKAPKGAIPLELADPFYVPDVKRDLSPLESAPEAVETTESPPFPEITGGVEPQAAIGYDANQTREPKRGLRPTKDGLKAIGGPTTTARLGYRVRMRGPNGELLSSELIENHTRARLRAHQLERSLQGTKDGRYVEMLPARRTFQAEQQPTPEPISDILAQVRDMQSRDALDMRADPDARHGVYLTRGTLEHLHAAGQLDQVLKSGVPIRNFDTYGGIMLAKDEDTALELVQFIEDEDSDIDEVIGYATGAGSKKPGGDNPVVQLLDVDRNVIRERQVKPEEAEATRRQWGDLARILPLEQALAIRQNRLQKEQAEQAAARKEQEYTATQPDKQVEELFDESPLTNERTEEAVGLAKQGGLEEDIGLRLHELAQGVREKDLALRKVDKRVPAPGEVKFHGRKLIEQRQEATRKRRRAAEAETEAEKLTAARDELRKKIGTSQQVAKEGKGKRASAYSDWLKQRAKDLPASAEAKRLDQQVKDLKAEIDQLTAELKSAKKAESGSQAKLEELHAEYRQLNDDLLTAALQVEMAKKTGSVQGVIEAEAAYDALVSKILNFYKLEGGYTRSEAFAKAAHRFSPKGTKEVLRTLAQEREQRRKEREQKAAGTPAQKYDSKDVGRAADAATVSVEAAAAKARRVRSRFAGKAGQQLADELYRLITPMSEPELNRLVEQVRSGKLARVAAKTPEEQVRLNRQLKKARRAARGMTDQARTEVSRTIMEINQLLRQWLSDYRLALRYNTPAVKVAKSKQRDAVLDRHVAMLTETLGNLRSYHEGDISIREDAAKYLAIRITDLVVHGKRYGVSAEMDIDGFWSAIRKGPAQFRDYLAGTVQTRDDVPFPIDVTDDELKALPLASLDMLYIKALEYLRGKRESNYRRRIMVKDLMEAMTERGIDLKGGKEEFAIEVWNPNTRSYEQKPLLKTPRQFFMRLFTHSYGVRGAARSMDAAQLEYLYKYGGTFTLIKKSGKRVEVPVLPKKAEPDERPLWKQLPQQQRQLPPSRAPVREREPGEKRETILRAAHALEVERYGGKLDSTPFVRKLGSSKMRAADLRYNVNVLLDDVAPRDLGTKSTEYNEKRAAALASLTGSLSSMEQYLTLINTPAFAEAAGDSPLLVHAKAYVRWLYEYGVSLSKAPLKSWAAFEEMSRVALDLHELASLGAEQFVEQIEPKFGKLMDVQIAAAASLDPTRLKGLTDPKRRVVMLAASHKRLLSLLTVNKRMSELWPAHPLYTNYVRPVLQKISDSVQRDGWPSYAPTEEEQDKVQLVLKSWRDAHKSPAMTELASREWGLSAEELHDDFWKPLHKTLRDAGFFDRDRALMKQFQHRVRLGDRSKEGFGSIEALSGGTDEVSGVDVVKRRWAALEAPDVGVQITADLTRRNQERIDKQLLSLEEDELEGAEITDRGVTRRITREDLARREALLATPLGKGASTARKLLTANDTIARFRKAVDNTNPTIQQIAAEEAAMVSTLRDAGLWKDTGTEMGTISLPDPKPLLNKLIADQSKLRRLRAKLDPEGWAFASREKQAEERIAALRKERTRKKISVEKFREQRNAIMNEAEAEYLARVGKTSVFDTKKAKRITQLNADIRSTMQELERLQKAGLGMKQVGSMAYRLVGPRLRRKELTKADAQVVVRAKLKGFELAWPVAEKIATSEVERLRAQLAEGKITHEEYLKQRNKAQKEALSKLERIRNLRVDEVPVEARGVLRAYSHLDRDALKFDISTLQGDYGTASSAEHEAFIGLRDQLNASDSVTMGELLTGVSSKLGPDHKYQPLIRAILKHAAHRRLNVRMSMGLNAPGGQPVLGRMGLEGNTPVILLNGPAFSEIGFHPIKALHVVLHEAVHAATVRTVTENPELMNALNSLRLLAKERLHGAHPYATSDVFEFVAEAYTNADFQHALKSVKTSEVEASSLWSQFVSWVRKLLGLDPQYDNLLDAVISLQEQTFGPAPLDRSSQRKVQRHVDAVGARSVLAYTDAEREVFSDIQNKLATNDTVPLGELLESAYSKLGPKHKYRPVIQAILQYAAHKAMPVRATDDESFALGVGGLGIHGEVSIVNGTATITLARSRILAPNAHPGAWIHVLLHEAVHAVTTSKMVSNTYVLHSIEALLEITKLRVGNAYPHATSSVFEFVAEAFSNIEFQQALKSIKVSKARKLEQRLWDVFVKYVRQVLGLDPQFKNVLEAIVGLQADIFGPDVTSPETWRHVDAYKLYTQSRGSLSYTDVATPLASSAITQHQTVQDLMRGAAASKDKIREQGQSWRLNALTMRQIEQIFGKYFGHGLNPLRKYSEAFERRNSYASELMETADVLSRRWSGIEESTNGEGVEVSRVMHDATVSGLHADKSSADVLRELQAAKEPDEKKIAVAQRSADKQDALHARFKALSPAAQQLYRDVRDYYKATQKLEVQLMLANALRASKLWNGEEIDAETINLEGISKGQWLEQKLGVNPDALREALKQERLALKADKETLSKEEFRKRRKSLKARTIDYENTIEELRLISRMASIPMINSGPYFPLMRFGDYAVKAERPVASEVYQTRQERTAAMDKWHEQDPTLQFSFPPTPENNFPLVVKEVEFRLAETYTEAQAAREELLQDYEGGTVTQVHLRHALINDVATIGSNSALQTLLGKLDGNVAAQAAIREFYIKSLSDRSFRKREAKRKNQRGADPTQQHRTFGSYAKSASYFTSQLKYGHIMAEAKAEMAKTAAAHNDESGISGVQMDQIVMEVNTRDKQAASPADVRPVVRKMVETGQIWLLLSPSYWMVNASQPYLVTLPWLAARSNAGIAMKALKDAQGLILDPLVKKGFDSWGGLKALKSRHEAEKAFSVMEDVADTLKKRLGEEGAKPVLDMLTALKRESIIDLSFIAELRNVAAGEKRTPWDRVMDASRVLAHLTEVNNRILTAIAAYNISKQQQLAAVQSGNVQVTPEQIEANATRFAKNAVAETQFDYSALNKARLFSAMDAWWKPVVFQFMQYVQHMYVLFFRHLNMWWKSPAGSRDKEVGRRVVLGLLMTHIAAGGLLGATPQLAKWALGLAMMLFGAGDDDDQTFQNWVSGEYFDRMTRDALDWMLDGGKIAEVARAGLPRLAGVDLSSRMAFLQTYMIDLDTRTTETLYGSLITSFGGPMFGIAGNAFDATEMLLKGDTAKAWEKLLPKLGRDAIRAGRFWKEGLTDHTGKVILGADKMSSWELFLTAVGFQPSQIAEVYSRNNRAREAESFVSKRKSEIMLAYRKARRTGDINEVMSDVREFNKQFPNPKDRITMSKLLRSLREMRESERNIQRYGVDAGRRSYEYAEDSYNVE